MAKNRSVLEPVLAVIGPVRLRDLDVTDLDRGLVAAAATRSSSTVATAHMALTKAITRAQAKNLVLRDVSALTGTPPGRAGRPGRSMTLAQATALTAAAMAAGPRMYAYIMLSLCAGVRTEEARALRWEHADLGEPGSRPPRPTSSGASSQQRGRRQILRGMVAAPGVGTAPVLAAMGCDRSSDRRPGERSCTGQRESVRRSHLRNPDGYACWPGP
jgi:integrase